MGEKGKRKAIPKSIRFEVFKRDKFKCSYCGATAPDVLLQVDHIDPVANGGNNNILNLTTACFDCNNGKRDKLLGDNSVVKKQRDQLEELQERRDQIEMMLKWQRELSDLKDTLLFELKEYWEKLAPGYSINDNGLKIIKKLLREFSYSEIKEAMDISSEQYLKYEDDYVTEDSWEFAYGKISGIAKVRRDTKNNPELKELLYIRGILKNKVRKFNSSFTLTLLKQALELGVSLDELKQFALKANNWTDVEEELNEIIERVGS